MATRLAGHSEDTTALAPRAPVRERSKAVSVTAEVVPGAAYGYMRVPCDISDDKVVRMERELSRFAESLGLRLVAIFSELVCGVHDAFNDLLVELQRADAHHVVVPTLRHLGRNRALQNCLLARLEFDAGAEVFELVETD